MTIRFHLDEHIHPGIAVGLRAHGIEVTSTLDAGLSGADDKEHIAHALAEFRVIVTHDDDFLRYHTNGVKHAGIAFCHQEKYSFSDHLRMLRLLHACYSQEEMHGQVEYL